MKIALDISRMNKLSLNRGIGIFAKNLYAALKKHSELDVDLIEKKINYIKYDLIHFPFFDFFTRTLPIFLPKPRVVTVHDIVPIKFMEHYPPGFKGRLKWKLQKIALSRASKIITSSEVGKKDIINFLKIDERKIEVVYPAPSDNFKKMTDENKLGAARKKYNLPMEFVLMVGNVNWNKNIINSTEGVIKSGKKLVIVGGAFLDKTNLNHPEKKAFKQWLLKFDKNPQIQLLGAVDEESLISIINLAKVLLFTSFYEGFGLPILEAQKCGTAVITSDTGGATAEIAGKGAILVDPTSSEEISKAVYNIFEHLKLRNRIIKSGEENLKRFSWEKTVTQTIEVYKNAIS